MINSPHQVNISIDNNFGPTANILITVLAFGVAVFDKDVVVIVVVFIPVEFKCILPLEIGCFVDVEFDE
jgi:hypothetical protein